MPPLRIETKDDTTHLKRKRHLCRHGSMPVVSKVQNTETGRENQKVNIKIIIESHSDLGYSRKVPMKIIKLSTLTLLLISTATSLIAQESTWTGKGGDRQWTTAANWSDDTLPKRGDSVTLADSGEVLFVGPDGNQYLPKGISLNLRGKTIFSNDQELVRLDTTELTVFSGASLMAGHLVFYSSQCIFHDGAIVQTRNWEQNGTNVFTFVLGSAGFTTVSASGVWFGDIKEMTYIADMAAYKGGEGVVVLMEFKKMNDGSAFTEDDFQNGAALRVENPGQFKGSKIRWNPSEKTLELVVAK
jgi:hypothetical protein